MKMLKIIGVGLSVWSMSLLWPQINERLSLALQVGLLLGLGGIILLYEMWRKHHQAQSGRNRSPLNDKNIGELTGLPGWSNL